MTSEEATISALFQQLCAAKAIPFPIAKEWPNELAKEHGVYVIRSPEGHVLHVGRTVSGKNGLLKRLNDHLVNSSSFTRRHLRGDGNKLRGKYTFSYLLVPNIEGSLDGQRRRALLEAYAVGHLCPEHLGLGEKSAD